MAAGPFDWLISQVRGAYEEEILWALRNVSFEVKHGEVLGVIGRNGAGKSTLLKILSRITEPTEGRAEIHGRIGSLLEVGTGMHPELTGQENIYLNGCILGMKKGEIDKQFREIVDFSGIEKFINTPVKRYSSGMRVRLGFAIAAHLDPEILLVDEVLAVGDLEFQARCIKKMESVSGQGRTVLFVSHNMSAVSRLCDRCILMDSGTVRADGETSDVVAEYRHQNQPQGRKEFRQDPHPGKDMNLLAVRVLDPGDDPTVEVDYPDSFRIEIDYEITRPVRNVKAWVGVETYDGIMAFSSADFDGHPELCGERVPGRYRATVRVPGKWLNPGTYQIIAGLVRKAPVTVYDRVEALQFEVRDVNTPGGAMNDHRRGILQPVLDWHTLPLPDSAGAVTGGEAA